MGQQETRIGNLERQSGAADNEVVFYILETPTHDDLDRATMHAMSDEELERIGIKVLRMPGRAASPGEG